MSSKTADDLATEAAMDALMREAWVLLGLGFLVTGLRTFARVRAVGWKGLQLDDYLAWMGSGSHAVETALLTYFGVIAHRLALANNGMTDEQRAALSPESREYELRVIGSKLQIVGWSGYTALLWTLKASLLVFYLRLTAGLNRGYRIRVYIGFGILGVSFLVVLLNLYLGCRPLHKYWQINPDPGSVCYAATSPQVVWVSLAFNVLTDVYLLSIPLPMLWSSTLKPLKKVGLMVVFGGGLLVIMCAVIRCVVIVSDPINGAQAAGTWAIRETFIAIATTNLPMIFPLFKAWLTPIFGSLLTSLRSTARLGRSGAGGTQGNSRAFEQASKLSRRGRGPRTVNPIPTTTFSDSEERIVDSDVKMQHLTPTGTPPPSKPKLSPSIRRQIEVEIVHEARADDMGLRLDLDGPRPSVDGNFSYARGPRRSSGFGLRKGPG